MFLPAFAAEKAFLILYLVGLPYAFRGLIKTIAPENKLLGYLVFPFTYSFPFHLGFYNFSIALVLLLVTLAYWIRLEAKQTSYADGIKLCILLTLTYFSHGFVFVLLLLFIGGSIAFNALSRVAADQGNLKQHVKQAIRKAGFFLVSSAIPLILFCIYFFSRNHEPNYSFLEQRQLIDWIKTIRPVIGYNTQIEEVYTKKIYYVFIVLTVIALYLRIDRGAIFYRAQHISSIPLRLLRALKRNVFKRDYWLLATLLLLGLYFTLPDSDGAAGYISIRLGLLFFMVLIIWLSAQKFPRWLMVLSAITVLYCTFKLNDYYKQTIKDYNKIALDCFEAHERIEPNSTVISLNFHNNWLVGNNFSNYLGIGKPVSILYNYECGTGYFPVKWNEKAMPNTRLGQTPLSAVPCAYWKSDGQKTPAAADYVFVLGELSPRDACTETLVQSIDAEYDLVHSNDNCKLYRLKKPT